MKSLIAYFKFIYWSPRYAVINLLFLVIILFLILETQHENTFHYNMIRITRQETKGADDTAYIRKLMTTINGMMYHRYDIFKGTEQLSWKNQLFHSVDADIMYGAGACGGFSKVLTRSLSLSGYRVRIGQMKVNGQYGGHIVVEVFLAKQGKWVVIDPLFLFTFKEPVTRQWASFAEVRANWTYYRKQINVPYNEAYAYEDVRYTNWEKIPLIGKLTYKFFNVLLGQNSTQDFSARVWMLNKYSFYLLLVTISYLLYHFFTLRYYWFKNR